jgi:hypothetical protein
LREIRKTGRKYQEISNDNRKNFKVREKKEGEWQDI